MSETAAAEIANQERMMDAPIVAGNGRPAGYIRIGTNGRKKSKNNGNCQLEMECRNVNLWYGENHVLHDIDLGHRHGGLARQFCSDPVKFRGFLLGNLLRSIHLEHDLIAEPVGEEVHQGRKDEGINRPALSSYGRTHKYEKAG
jgi:hypothetical protein